MKLNLKRPLVIFDLETTGLDIARDRIIEIAYIKVFPNGEEASHRLLINPEMHIPETSTEVHGISDADVADCPTFRQKAQEIANDFIGSDIAGFNSNNFDIPMLTEEFNRVGIIPDFIDKAAKVDVQVIYHKMEKRTLSAAYLYYCGKDHIDAHSALGDVQATYEVLQAQLDKYPNDIHNDIQFLSEFTTTVRRVDAAGRIIYNEQNIPCFSFGKYKGRPVVDVFRTAPGYYEWMMQSDFPEQTKSILTKIKLSMK